MLGKFESWFRFLKLMRYMHIAILVKNQLFNGFGLLLSNVLLNLDYRSSRQFVFILNFGEAMFNYCQQC